MTRSVIVALVLVFMLVLAEIIVTRASIRSAYWQGYNDCARGVPVPSEGYEK